MTDPLHPNRPAGKHGNDGLSAVAHSAPRGRARRRTRVELLLGAIKSMSPEELLQVEDTIMNYKRNLLKRLQRDLGVDTDG